MIESEPLHPQIKYRDTILDFEDFPQIEASEAGLPPLDILDLPLWTGEPEKAQRAPFEADTMQCFQFARPNLFFQSLITPGGNSRFPTPVRWQASGHISNKEESHGGDRAAKVGRSQNAATAQLPFSEAL